MLKLFLKGQGLAWDIQFNPIVWKQSTFQEVSMQHKEFNKI